MRILFILTLSFSFCLKGFAQNQHVIDSLQKVITEIEKNCPKPCTADTGRINAYLSWYEEVFVLYPDSAMELMRQAKIIVENLLATHPIPQIADTIKKDLAIILNNIGSVYFDQDDLPDGQAGISKALEYYNKSLNISEEIGNKQGIITSMYHLGRLSQKQNDILQLEKYATRGYDQSKELGFPENIKDAASLMKNLCIKQKNYEKADSFAIEVIAINNKAIMANFVTLPESGQEKYFIAYFHPWVFLSRS